jgi:hypothetical protein
MLLVCGVSLSALPTVRFRVIRCPSFGFFSKNGNDSCTMALLFTGGRRGLTKKILNCDVQSQD